MIPASFPSWSTIGTALILFSRRSLATSLTVAESFIVTTGEAITSRAFIATSAKLNLTNTVWPRRLCLSLI